MAIPGKAGQSDTRKRRKNKEDKTKETKQRREDNEDKRVLVSHRLAEVSLTNTVINVVMSVAEFRVRRHTPTQIHAYANTNSHTKQSYTYTHKLTNTLTNKFYTLILTHS